MKKALNRKKTSQVERKRVMMKKSIVYVLFVLLVSALVVAEENDCLIYFTGTGCTDCETSDHVMDALQAKYPGLQIQRHNVYLQKEDSVLFDQYVEGHNIQEKQGIPAVFVSDSYFIGNGPITTLLEERIIDNDVSSCPVPEGGSVVGIAGKASPAKVIEAFSFLTVTGSALKDSIRLGLLAVMAFFVLISLGMKDKTEMVRRGIIFGTGVMIAYLFRGFGFFESLSIPIVTATFLKIVGLGFVVFGIYVLKHFFVKGRFVFRNPETFAKHKSRFVVILCSWPTLVVSGFVLSLFSFAHTMISFTLLQVVLADVSTRWIGLPLLIYYCVLLLLPLLLLLIVLYLVRTQIEGKVEHKATYVQRRTAWEQYYQNVYFFGLAELLLIAGLIFLFVS